MIEEALQLRLDQALATRPQRWVLGGTAVAAAVIASVLVGLGAASGPELAIATVVSAVVAAIAVSGSGTHAGSVLIALVALEWVVFVDDETSPRVIGVACCIYVFHSLLALMAATPHTTVIDRRVLHGWAVRSVIVVAATVAVWALVVALDRRGPGGSESLTLLALVTITAVVVALRRAIFAPTNGRGTR